MGKETEEQLLFLFEAFALKCMQLQQAIRLGDDHLVRVLDRELEPLIAAVLAYRADSIFDVYMQLQFLSNLIREDADDRSSVMRHSAALSVLLDRYFGGVTSGRPVEVLSELTLRDGGKGVMPSNDSFLNEVILDSLPDRVAVITPDYRFLYSNPANAAYINRSPIDLVGRHVIEFIGQESFDLAIRANLDLCFAGASLDFVHDCRIIDVSLHPVRCRMTPLRTTSATIIGAVLVWHDVPIVSEEIAA